MVGDVAKFFGLTTLLALCVLTTNAGPCFSRTSEPAPVIVLAAGPGRHVIKAGDTIAVLAQRYNVPAAAILKANPGLDPARLQLGREILIPTGGGATPVEENAVSTSSTPQGIELRPAKAPQATPAPGSGVRSYDLPDSPAGIAALQARKQAAASSAPATAAKKTAETEAHSTEAVKAPAQASTPPPAPAPVEKGTSATPTPTPPTPSAASLPPAPAQTTAPAAPVAATSTRAEWNWNGPWLYVAAGAVVVLLGVALQGILANIAAGWALGLLRVVRTGDVVKLAGFSGRVTALRRFYVVIRSEAGEMVFVPNAKAFSEILVVSKNKKSETA